MQGDGVAAIEAFDFLLRGRQSPLPVNRVFTTLAGDRRAT
jgi:hypothetical protein